MIRIAGFVALAIVALAPATASEAAACKTTGDAHAQALIALPATADPAFNRAIAHATEPATVAAARAAMPCRRGGKLAGDNGDAFPRIWDDPTHKSADIGFLAPVRLGDKTYYALVKAWGSGAVRLDGLFDAIPADGPLNRAMNDFVDGGYDPLTVNAAGKLIDVNGVVPGLLAATAARMRSAAPSR